METAYWGFKTRATIFLSEVLIWLHHSQGVRQGYEMSDPLRVKYLGEYLFDERLFGSL